MILAAASGCTAEQARQVALPNQFVPVWSAAVEPGSQIMPQLYAITSSSSSIVAPMPDGTLAVLAPRTGRLEHSIAPDHGWSFSDVTVIGERLYTYLTTLDGTTNRFVAYDLSTGRSVWQTNVAVDQYGMNPQQPIITPHGIVIQLSAAGLLQGLRVSDGKPTWQTRLPPGCQDDDSVGTPSTAVFLLWCTRDIRLVTVDSAYGHASWQRILAANPDAAPTDLLTANLGDIIAQAGSTMRIFTPGGRLIVTRGCQDDDCKINADGPVGVLSLGENEPVVQGIDLSTGQVLWQQAGKLIDVGSPAAQGADGLLFALAGRSLVGESSGLLPAFVLVMQASTGRSTVLPLPVPNGSEILGSTADLLIVESEEWPKKAFITAFRPEHDSISGPAVLGGVTPTEWPDACKLLTPADLRFIAPGYVGVPRPVTLSGATWPKPVTCAYIGPGADDPAITLTVEWIAASNQQADELLGTLPDDSQKIPGGYLIEDGGFPSHRDRALIAVGRAIVTVTVLGYPSDARKLAPLVAARLSAAYGAG